MPLVHASSYPIGVNLAIFGVAAVFVWLAGTRLSRCLGRVSDITGIEQAFVGMLMLGTLTSLPEIANVATAAHFGNPALAANNLLGSAAINLVLIAVIDIVVGREALTSIVAQPTTLLQSTLCMLVLVLAGIAITTGDVAIFGVGGWTLGLFVVSLGAFALSKGYSRRTSWTVRGKADPSRRGGGAKTRPDRSGLKGLLAQIAVAALVVLIAGYALSQTGDALAEQTGLGSGLVGFLLIGFATSLPELSSITTSARAGRHEMAIGEVLGTNFVNVSLLLLADAVYAEGPVLNELGRFEAILALLGALLTGVYLVGLLERRNPVVLRMGYDSLAVLVIFGLGVALLVGLR